MDGSLRADVLVVDDAPANLTILSRMLRGGGHEPRTATNGAEAFALMEQAVPDLVLLDIDMPLMSGFDVCARMKEDPRLERVPVVFISARTDPADKVKAFAAGGVDYVAKPFNHQEVIARVNAHLELARLEKELVTLNTELEERVRQRTSELAALNEANARFVPREFLGMLEKQSIADVRLGDQVQRDMTVMFTDIRDFTALSESMSPQANFDFLNAYLGRVTRQVRTHGGLVDKYIGDAVMSLYPQSSDDAVHASIAIAREMRAFSDELEASGRPRIRAGSGLHAGSLMLGIVGAEDRFDATVISDAVNTASRLDGLAKLYGAEVVVSDAVLDRVRDRNAYCHRPLGIIRVYGRATPLQVHEIFDGDDDDSRQRKLDTRADFVDALALYYDQRFAEAALKLDAVTRASPDDPLYRLYLQRAAQFLATGAPPGWTGVEQMSSK